MNIERALSLQEQAWMFQEQGRLDEAVQACRAALELVEASEGPDSPDVANLLIDLAELDHERGHPADALGPAERARAILEAVRESLTQQDDALLSIRLFGLFGDLRTKLGDYASAAADLEQAYAIAVRVFGDQSAEAATAANALGVAYKYAGRCEDALRLYQKTLGWVDALHGRHSLQAGVVLHNIGGALHARGDFQAAEAPARQAWDISRQQLGEHHRRSALDAVAYAAVLDGLGRYEESESLYRGALSILEHAFGPSHVEVAATLHNLAAVCAVRARPEEAEHLYRRALEIRDARLGVNHPDGALTRNNLGRLLVERGRAGEGVPVLRKAVGILQDRLSPEHAHVQRAREHLSVGIAALAHSQPGCPG